MRRPTQTGARRTVFLGSGGHARALWSIVRSDPGVRVVGATSPRGGEFAPGVPLLGGDDVLPGLFAEGVACAVVALGGTADNAPRRRLYDLARSLGFEILSVVAPSAVVAAEASLGRGVQVMPGAIVGPFAALGDGALVNSGAIVEHDCILEDHAHVATGARLASGVRVGRGAHVGLDASVRQTVSLGPGAVVGAGAVVLEDVPAGVTVVGVPAKRRP